MANDTRDLRTATETQRAFIKACTRKLGATRKELQDAAGSAFPPDAWHLDRLAEKFGFKCYADTAPRAEGVTVYQFVRPGEKPTAYATRAQASAMSKGGKKKSTRRYA